MNDNKSSTEPSTEPSKENMYNMEDNKKPHENNAMGNVVDNDQTNEVVMKKKQK